MDKTPERAFFCREIFVSPQLFCFAVAFLFCRGFFSFAVAFFVLQQHFCFAAAFLFCRDFFILPWFFYFAVAFLFCCGFFILPWFLLCCGFFVLPYLFYFAVKPMSHRSNQLLYIESFDFWNFIF